MSLDVRAALEVFVAMLMMAAMIDLGFLLVVRPLARL